MPQSLALQRADGSGAYYGVDPAVTVVAGTNPAANTEITETVPAGKYWRLLAVSVSLVQGITQTPWPVLILDDGSTTLYESFSGSSAQAVSTTARHTWGVGLTPAIAGATTNVHATGALPRDLLLGPGYRVRTATVGIGVNTDYGAPTLTVVEYT